MPENDPPDQDALAAGDLLDRLHGLIRKLVAERDIFRDRYIGATKQMDEMTLRLDALTARRKTTNDR